MQRAISRSRVAIDRGRDRDIDRFVECLQVTELLGRDHVACPHPQNARAKHPVLGDNLREIEALFETYARMQLGKIERRGWHSAGTDVLRNIADAIEQVGNVIEQQRALEIPRHRQCAYRIRPNPEDLGPMAFDESSQSCSVLRSCA
ncbi:MAG TPA: hypothetical protein VGG74_03970 [Kofleriaceae bacterium]